MNSNSTTEDKRATLRWVGEAEMYSCQKQPTPGGTTTIGRDLKNIELFIEEQGVCTPYLEP